MSTSKIKTNALKRILHAPLGKISDEELLRLVKKQDRSAECLVLKKFVQAVSEIPLVEFDKNLKVFSFNRDAYKARCYFMFICYLFGVTIGTKWPDLRKFTDKIKQISASHFVSSYCVQTIISEKLNSYNIQIQTLISYIIKQGKQKEVIFDNLINTVLVDFFPSSSFNWLWLYNEIIKANKPKDMAGLSVEKAQKDLIRLVKKAAKDCEIEVQRLRLNSSSSAASVNYALAASANSSAVSVAKQSASSDPVIREAIALGKEHFPRIRGSLEQIGKMTGAKVELGVMGSGAAGFVATGTKAQRASAMEEVFRLIEVEVPRGTSPPPPATPGESLEVITYSTDIMQKFVNDREMLTLLGSFSERYRNVNIKVEPHKKRISVRGKIHGQVKAVAEYLRESISDFASDLVSRKHNKPASQLPTSNTSPDVPVTRFLSTGNKHNAWIRENQKIVLNTALKNHVTLRFPISSKPLDSVQLSGKQANVDKVDKAICELIKADSMPRYPEPPPRISLQSPRLDATASDPSPRPCSEDSFHTASSTPTSPKRVSWDGSKSREDSGPAAKSDPVVDWFEREMSPEKENEPPVIKCYEELELKEQVLRGIYSYGLDTPSTVHSALLPLLLAESTTKLCIEAELGEDIGSALLITLLQQVNPYLKQTQGFLVVRDSRLCLTLMTILKNLQCDSLIKCEVLSENVKIGEVPHIVISTPSTLQAALSNEELKTRKAKVVIFTDLSLSVETFGYRILQLSEYFPTLGIEKDTKLVYQSGIPLTKKVLSAVDKHGSGSLKSVSFKQEEVLGVSKFIIPKKGSQEKIESRLNNLTDKQMVIAFNNDYLVYSVTRDYPDLEVTFGKDEIILHGRSSDVNQAKSRIQEMIALHDKSINSPSKNKNSTSDTQDVTPTSVAESSTEPVQPPAEPPETAKTPTEPLTPTVEPPKPRQPGPMITKLVSMTPQENGFIYRNRSVVENIILGFPGSSVEFSLYENDNISVTSSVEDITKLHQAVVQGIRDRLAKGDAKQAEPGSGRLSAELENYTTPSSTPSMSTPPTANTSTPPTANTSTPPTANTTTPPTANLISFDTSAELKAAEMFDPTAPRHQHTVLSPLTQPGGPPGYSTSPSPRSPAPPSSRPPVSDHPVAIPTTLPAANGWPDGPAVVIADDRPNSVGPVTSSSSTRPPMVTSSPSTRPPMVTSSPSTRPPMVTSSPSTRPPMVTSSPSTRPPMVTSSPSTRPPMVTSSPSTRPPMVTSSPSTRPPSTTYPATQTNMTSATRPPTNATPAAAATLATSSRSPQAPPPVAPNGIPWHILHRIPVHIRDLKEGSPEQWIYAKLRASIVTGNVTSIIITDLVTMFITQFKLAGQVNFGELTQQFYKLLKSNTGLFVTRIKQIKSGKRTIEVSLNLPKDIPLPVPAPPIVPQPAPTPSLPLPTSERSSSSRSSLRTVNFEKFLYQEDPVSSSSIPEPVSSVNRSEPEVAPVPMSEEVTPEPTYEVVVPEPMSEEVAPQPTSEEVVVPEPMSEEVMVPEQPEGPESFETCPESLDESESEDNNPETPESSDDVSDVTVPDSSEIVSEVTENSSETLVEHPVAPTESSSEPLQSASEFHQTDIPADAVSDIPANADPEPNAEMSDIPDNESVPASESTKTESTGIESASAEPAKTESAETEPAKTESAETESAETESTETEPASAESAEMKSAETESAETEPTETIEDSTKLSDISPDTDRSGHSSGSDYVVCNKSEAGSDLSAGSSVVMVQDAETVSQVVKKIANLEITEDNLTINNENNIEDTQINECDEEEEEEDEEFYTTFFNSNSRRSTSIGVSSDGSFVNINVDQPSWILLHGSDPNGRNSVMKQIVDVWVKKNLPVLVVSPKLETVSSHSEVEFYQFKTLTATEDPALVSHCETFLTTETSLKLFLINTTNTKTMDTNNFMTALSEQYGEFNVVVVSISPPPSVSTITGLLSTWRRIKKDPILEEISETFDIQLGPEFEKVKRGSLVLLTLDDDDVTSPVVFTSLFGR